MASKLSLTLRLSIYFSRDHSTLPAEIRTHSEVPGPCSLQVHKDLFAIKRQTPLIALFPDAFQLDYGAYLARAQIQLFEINCRTGRSTSRTPDPEQTRPPGPDYCVSSLFFWCLFNLYVVGLVFFFTRVMKNGEDARFFPFYEE